MLNSRIENNIDLGKSQRISICDGWIVNSRSDGSNSIVSIERVWQIEEEIHRYNAIMDLNNGGCDRNNAYTNYGFVMK